MDSVDVGSKKVYCRCWQSGTFPLCDGKHMAHNKETGDNVGPLIVSGPKEEKKESDEAAPSKRGRIRGLLSKLRGKIFK